MHFNVTKGKERILAWSGNYPPPPPQGRTIVLEKLQHTGSQENDDHYDAGR